MKKTISLILFLLSTQIFSQSTMDSNKKLWYISINRAWTNARPYEIEQYTDIFGPYKRNPKRDINNHEINLRKKFSDSKFGIYSEFYEIVKRDLSLKYLTYQNKTIVGEDPTPIGNYFRLHTRFGISYEFSKHINIIFGSRFFKSELTDGNSNNFQIRFGQKYVGPEFAIEIKTDTFHNFYLENRISYFLLYGRSYHNYSFRDRTVDQGYINVDIEPITRVEGIEGLLKIGYYFNPNFFMTLGYKYTYQRIRPDDLRVYSGDKQFDFQVNTDYGFRKINSYLDSMNSIILEVGIEL
ncbi:hypothetical protein AB3N60_10990 [Leptospira sp. WS39.C2]